MSEKKFENWLSASPLEFKKRLLQNFLEQTVIYAQEHMKQRETELSHVSKEFIDEILQRQERLAKWAAYVEFQNHTLDELKGEKIDRFIL